MKIKNERHSGLIDISICENLFLLLVLMLVFSCNSSQNEKNGENEKKGRRKQIEGIHLLAKIRWLPNGFDQI